MQTAQPVLRAPEIGAAAIDNLSDATPGPLGLRVRTLSLSCGEIACIDEGAGPAILLLHGAPLTSLGFVRVIRALRSRYRVFAPDFPGFGGSHADPRFTGSLADHARFVEELCRTLGLRDFHVFLNDSSACVGFVGLAPLADEVAGLVVASTVALPLTGRFALVRFMLKHLVCSSPMRLLNRRFNLLPWLVTTVAPFLRPFARDERRVLQAQFDTADKRDRMLHMFAQMGRDEAFMRQAGDEARTRFARTPALLLYGQFDPMRLLGSIAAFRRTFPRHTVRIVPFEEHFPILASGAHVGRVVDEWIRSLPPAC